MANKLHTLKHIDLMPIFWQWYKLNNSIAKAKPNFTKTVQSLTVSLTCRYVYEKHVYHDEFRMCVHVYKS